MSGRAHEGALPWMEIRDLPPILEKVRPFTMVPVESLVDLVRRVREILIDGICGDFVECGVWRGGAAFLMAELLRHAGVRDRKVWLFDSFEGIPSPEEIDGGAALAWARNTDGPWYHDNLRVSLEEAQQSAKKLGLAQYTEFVKGWFDHTLPVNRERVGPIAILRIDCDWYKSVRCCLENLYDQVVDGGFIIFDDYYTYDGCAIAVHEFLGKRRLAHRIETVLAGRKVYESCQSALFRKGKPTWGNKKWAHLVDLACREIAALVPAGDVLVLVDQDKWGTGEWIGGRRRIPFLERDGVYWGPPSDDDAGIVELERLRQTDAKFIVFGWPAFWWLDHYSGFHHYLRSRFPCILQNERIIAFDLRR